MLNGSDKLSYEQKRNPETENKYRLGKEVWVKESKKFFYLSLES